MVVEKYSKPKNLGSLIVEGYIKYLGEFLLSPPYLNKDGTPKPIAWEKSKGYKLPIKYVKTFGIERWDNDNDTYVIDSHRPGRTILYVHGGAYWEQPNDIHFAFLRKIVNRIGGKAIFPVYPKAPRHTYRDVYAMIEPIYDKLLSDCGDENIVFMGDSAGGGFIVAFALYLNGMGKPVPQLVALSPWLDVTMTNPDIHSIKDKWMNINNLIACGKGYAGDRSPSDPLISPIYGDVSKLENISVFIGTNDYLYADCDLLAQRNPNVQMYIYENRGHDFALFPIGNERKDAFEKICSLIKKYQDIS